MESIYIKAIGAVDSGLLGDLGTRLSTVVPFPIKIQRDNEYPLFAFEPKRNQYYAKMIIKNLAIELPHDCEKMIGVTDIDLCTPILTFVYGEAQLGGNVAIVSLHRLTQEFYHLPRNRVLLIDRLLKECVHELGHCYGLVHCGNSQCVMFLSNSVFNIDNKQGDFCVMCREFFNEKIRKENHG
jgi:archaemetzincin